MKLLMPLYILLLLLYSNIYKGLRSFVLVLWMQRQCPVNQQRKPWMKSFYDRYKMRTPMQNILRHLKIPGVSDNNTEILEQTEPLSEPRMTKK